MSWIDEKTLWISDETRPLVTAASVLPLSILHDPLGQEGLTYLTTQMLTRGAGDYDRAALHEELDLLGAQLHVSTSRNGTTVSGDVLSRNLDAYQELVATVLTKPRFDAEEFAKLKRQTLAEIEQIRDHDDALGSRFFIRELFQDHPYGRPSMGTEASLGQIELSHVVDWYERYLGGETLIHAGCGDLSAERMSAFIAGTVGQLGPAQVPTVEIPVARPIGGRHVTLVDKPGRSQTQVFMGQPTLQATHPDYIPLMVGNTIFGGTFTARLSHEIREKRGWSYGVSSSVAADLDFRIHVRLAMHLVNLTAPWAQLGPHLDDCLPVPVLRASVCAEDPTRFCGAGCQACLSDFPLATVTVVENALDNPVLDVASFGYALGALSFAGLRWRVTLHFDPNFFGDAARPFVFLSRKAHVLAEGEAEPAAEQAEESAAVDEDEIDDSAPSDMD